MKEMIYYAKRKMEILFSGEYKGHKFCIMNLGTHPTAYVQNKIKDLNSYGDDRLGNIDVHGGFTYLDRSYWDKTDRAIYLGWDYAHYCDYAGYYTKFNFCNDYECKRWTTTEIYEEVKSVIEQLIVLEERWGADESLTP